LTAELGIVGTELRHVLSVVQILLLWLPVYSEEISDALLGGTENFGPKFSEHRTGDRSTDSKGSKASDACDSPYDGIA